MESLVQLTGLPCDTIILLGGHFSTIPAAVWFNRYKSTKGSVWFSRDSVCSMLGVLLVVVCYRWSSLHLFLQWVISYILLHTVPTQQLGKITFVVIYSHVLLVNAYKFMYQYGDTSIDYTGSLMLGTMKLTSLAFAIEDSARPKESLTELQKKHIIEDGVSLQEHFNYYFSFIGILFGPFIFYGDHKRFINRQSTEIKSNVKLATLTLLYGLSAVVFVFIATPYYPVEKNYDEDVLASGFMHRHWVLYVTMFVAKCKYYFIWLIAQSVCLFAGYDADGDGDKDSIIATVNPVKIELTTSLKQFIDNWNIFTAKWLRYTCFERVPKHKALVTFVVSALWHGFLPGYMMMFVPLAVYSIVGQKLHKVVRPLFQGSHVLRVIYAVITWIGAAVTICFNGTGFQLLFFDKICQVQFGLYCYPHIIALILLVVIPAPAKRSSHNVQSKIISNGVHYKPHID